MTRNGLHRLYPHLTPLQRTVAVISAVSRGDQTEARRLSATATRSLCRVPDCYALTDTLGHLTFLVQCVLLDLAAFYWKVSGADLDLGPDDDAPATEVERDWYRTVRGTAYALVTKLAGWRLFCSGLGLDPPDVLLADLPGWSTVLDAAESAKRVAFTFEEVKAWLRAAGNPDAFPMTPETEAAWMRGFLGQQHNT